MVALAEDSDTFINFKSLLAQIRNPKIYGGTGNISTLPPYRVNTLNEVLDKTKGMRLMGQSYIPDSYMFQNLIFPNTGYYIGNDNPFTMVKTEISDKVRGFPRGLDLMAVLGSERAYKILKKEGDTDYMDLSSSYNGYNEQLDLMKSEFSKITIVDWNRNLYWGWLYSLKPLLKDYCEGYPIFMQTQAWNDKQLQTALGSWTELRHDTILYAKHITAAR